MTTPTKITYVEVSLDEYIQEVLDRESRQSAMLNEHFDDPCEHCCRPWCYGCDK